MAEFPMVKFQNFQAKGERKVNKMGAEGEQQGNGRRPCFDFSKNACQVFDRFWANIAKFDPNVLL